MRIHTIKPDDPSTWSDIYHCQPGHEFVYRLRDCDGVLLYIGTTWSAKARWAKHRAKKPWWSTVALAEIQCYPSDAAALTAELHAIKTERPLYNIRGAV